MWNACTYVYEYVAEVKGANVRRVRVFWLLPEGAYYCLELICILTVHLLPPASLHVVGPQARSPVVGSGTLPPPMIRMCDSEIESRLSPAAYLRHSISKTAAGGPRNDVWQPGMIPGRLTYKHCSPRLCSTNTRVSSVWESAVTVRSVWCGGGKVGRRWGQGGQHHDETQLPQL